MIFQDSYIIFDKDVNCCVLPVSKPIRLETAVYKFIKEHFIGWDCRRMETPDQDGFPDVLLMKGKEYILIEAKVLKKKKLVSVADDIKYEFGQLAFMARSFTKGRPYLLAVGKGTQVAFIGKKETLKHIG